MQTLLEPKSELRQGLETLVALTRAMNLFYHNCHNVVYGPQFASDHQMFGEFYVALDADYDQLAERCVGVFGRQCLDLNAILEKVETILEDLTKPHTSSVDDMLASAVKAEHELLTICNFTCKAPGVTSGIEQLVGTIAEQSEIRSYKLMQRIITE